MAEQSFASHAHQPVLSLVASVFTLIALVAAIGAWAFAWPTLVLAVVALALAAATFVVISRVYTTRLQDRIIMLEMKVRCSALLAADQAARLSLLTPKQIAALRFASDAELAGLLDRAVREQMAPTDIKRAITQWRPDYFRT